MIEFRRGQQMIKRLPFICASAFAACALCASPSLAQTFDGSWHGQLTCAKLSFTKGTQKVPMTMTVSGGAASYSRQVYNRDNTRVVGAEEGSGTVSSDGQIKLSTKWSSPDRKFAFTASYVGTLNANSGDLHGTQVWSFDGKTENRSCSMALRGYRH